MTIEEQIVSTLRTLPFERQREVLDYIEFLRLRSKSEEAIANVAADWPPGFFEEVAGSLPDFPEIDGEGDFEERTSLE